MMDGKSVRAVSLWRGSCGCSGAIDRSTSYVRMRVRCQWIMVGVLAVEGQPLFLIAENGDRVVEVEAEDAAGGDRWVVEGGMVGEAEVDTLFQGGVDVGRGGGGRMAGEVGGGADQGAA